MPGVREWMGRAVSGAAAVVVAASLVGVTGTQHAAAVAASAVGPTARNARQEMGLREAIAQLPVAAERRDGYTRDKFRHWVDEDRDGCNTRNEVLLDEATWTPEIGPGCRLSGGRWSSYYDDVDVDEAARLDIDHMVPLAEAWDSGAYTWDAGRRQRYANDLGDPRALAAVTARANRSKADQDPADWLPPTPPRGAAIWANGSRSNTAGGCRPTRPKRTRSPSWAVPAATT